MPHNFYVNIYVLLYKIIMFCSRMLFSSQANIKTNFIRVQFSLYYFILYKQFTQTGYLLVDHMYKTISKFSYIFGCSCKHIYIYIFFTLQTAVSVSGTWDATVVVQESDSDLQREKGGDRGRGKRALGGTECGVTLTSAAAATQSYIYYHKTFAQMSFCISNDGAQCRAVL